MKDNALYLEADEDITSAIDKLKKSAGDSVQIVVPKRSTMLQSIINLKLLKKAAESSGKELVLVTNDRIAGELAARVGLAVAPSLGAKPVLAEAEMPADLKSGEEVIEADDPEPPAAPEPETAKPAPPKKPLSFKRKDVGAEPPEPADEPDAAPAAAADSPAKKRPRVPNFNQLQKRALWIGLAAFLVIGYVAFMFFFTSAKVVLFANGTKVDIDTTFSVDPNLHTTDTAKGVLAGQLVTVSKDLSGPFTPTGKKDVGTKATGTMTIYNEYDTSSHTLVAGTRLQAPDGKIFKTRSDVSVPGASLGFTFPFTVTPGQAQVTVDADQNGDAYNEGPAQYTIVAYSGTMQQKIYGKGGQMSGGTTKTVTVVSQSDVDGAKADLLDKDKDNATRDLKGKLPSGYVALDTSQNANVTQVSSAPDVNAEGDNATLTLKVTYTVLAVKQSDYQAVVRHQEESQLGAGNQVYDDGLANAQVTATDKDAATGRQNFHLTTEAWGGAKLDTKAIATQLAGKKFGDAADTAKRQPGVSDASILLWPGWATNLPTRAGKISVTIQVTNKQ